LWDVLRRSANVEVKARGLCRHVPLVHTSAPRLARRVYGLGEQARRATGGTGCLLLPASGGASAGAARASTGARAATIVVITAACREECGRGGRSRRPENGTP